MALVCTDRKSPVKVIPCAMSVRLRCGNGEYEFLSEWRQAAALQAASKLAAPNNAPQILDPLLCYCGVVLLRCCTSVNAGQEQWRAADFIL